MKTTRDPISTLFHQADAAGIRLTPAMGEGLANGNPRMIAYVADLIAVRGLRPAIETRHDGGPLDPGKTYTVNENGPEQVLDRDGHAQQAGDGRPAVITPKQPGMVLPSPSSSSSQGLSPYARGPNTPDVVDSMPRLEVLPQFPQGPGPVLSKPVPPKPVLKPHLDEAPGLPGSLRAIAGNSSPPGVDGKANPPKPVKPPTRTLGTATAIVPRTPDFSSHGQPLDPLQKAKVGNAIVALRETPSKEHADEFLQMLQEGRIRVDPRLDDVDASAETWYGGGGLNLNGRYMKDPGEERPGGVVAGITEDLAHEHDHMEQWRNPITRGLKGSGEKLRFFFGTEDKTGKWGPLEWGPHQTGYKAHDAAKDYYDRHYYKGDRGYPIDPYFTEQKIFQQGQQGW